ncbi:MAG: BofC C-terminal domain-containing protein [Candidatus Pristimantibacillus lignocellulolyticus]|uniref:BofC C-terminal domain-containing protein n=1 Tax=Candidatus Pristimantibacillus lignocellulolyticus TaxID=2994561 RepID=A0A9J6ZA65_9BACL|nr:MAG: BofC C-terminal domain-containing protein [Candidatus Pristimantibacillus lignocellulolyticus]
MRYTSMWKRLKRKLKQNRGMRRKLFLALQMKTLLSGVVILYFISMSVGTVHAQAHNNYISNYEIDDLSTWLNGDKKIHTILHRVYVCGEEIEQLDELNYEEVVIMAEQNPNWELTVDQSYTLIRFVEQIDDLSPYCKKNAFFGMNSEGEFSLFDGQPSQEKVMKTFFQLNVPYLESSLPEQEWEHLMNGIRVSDIEEYDSVLSTYSEYSMDRYEPNINVMSDLIGK